MPGVRETARPGRRKPVPIKRGPRADREQIFDIAFEEFAENGLSGQHRRHRRPRQHHQAADLRTISARRRAVHRGAGDGLCGDARRRGGSASRGAGAGGRDPPACRITFDFHQAHPQSSASSSSRTSIADGTWAHQPRVKEMTQPSISQIAKVLERGAALRRDPAGIDPVELHMTLKRSELLRGRQPSHVRGAIRLRTCPRQRRGRSAALEIADLLWRCARGDRTAAGWEDLARPERQGPPPALQSPVRSSGPPRIARRLETTCGRWR